MNTPREILLARHQAAWPKLEAIRAGVVADMAMESAPEVPWWRAWLWPCPRAWAGLAAVWLCILGMNLAAGRSPSRAAAAMRPVSRQELAELGRRHLLLAKLISPAEEAEPPAAILSPRSERRKTSAHA